MRAAGGGVSGHATWFIAAWLLQPVRCWFSGYPDAGLAQLDEAIAELSPARWPTAPFNARLVVWPNAVSSSLYHAQHKKYKRGNVQDIWIFLDESGTHATADRLLVGAVVAPDREAIESAVIDAFEDVTSQGANWAANEDIEEFISRGFHFTEDNVSVRNEFVRRLSTMNVRIHVAYSASGPETLGAPEQQLCTSPSPAAYFGDIAITFYISYLSEKTG